MLSDEYLNCVLIGQTLTEDGPELRELRKHRGDVDKLLRAKYGTAPSIRYGGSKAKGTMIRESYDLDIHCAFPRDYRFADNTLHGMYEDMATTLGEGYLVERKRSALRLTSNVPSTRGVYLHIDAVPSRFIDGEDGDVFLYQNEGEKDRLQTNLDVHIAHIQGSGVVDAIRLLKLWKVRNGLLQVKTFVLELLTVDLLKHHKQAGLTRQLELVLTAFRDEMDTLSVQDPANPNGNDLSRILDEARPGLASTATRTLRTVEEQGWEAIFGPVGSEPTEDTRSRLQSIAVSVPTANRTKPWCPGV